MQTRRCIPLLLGLLVGACACDAGNDQQAQPESEQSVATQVQAQKGERFRSTSQVALLPKTDDGIGGTALIVRPPGDSIELRVTLHGVEPGTGYPVHVHRGTCQTGGAVATSLRTVAAQDSMASSATKFRAVDLSPDGAYFIQAHLPDGTPAACGNVPTGAFDPLGGT